MSEPKPPEPDPQHDVVLDAKGLRALAHPVRVQLVGMLRKHGPSTATRLAERLGVNSGTASYHLRQLGAAGFVEEDTERGNARERWWRSRHQKTWFNSVELAQQEPEAAMAYLQSVHAMDTLRTQRVLSEFPTMPEEWQRVFDVSSQWLRLTPREAEALQREMWAVMERYRVAAAGTESAEAAEGTGAERVTVQLQMLPELGIAPPESDDR